MDEPIQLEFKPHLVWKQFEVTDSVTGFKSFFPILFLSLTSVVLSCSCGDTAPPPSRSSVSIDRHMGAGGNQLYGGHQREPSNRPIGHPVCANAQVRLGSGPREIQFVVRCVGSHDGSDVGFTLGRYSLRGRHSRQGIQAATRRPILSGPGVRESSDGSCERLARGSWVRDGVYCHAKAFGELTMSGRILTKSDRRCAMGVLITAAVRSQCNTRVCPASAQYRTLASGRPQGC